MYLKENLKYLMNKHQLSYRDLSKSTGITINIISHLLTKDDYRVSLETALKLSYYFSISLDDLVNKNLTNQLHGQRVLVEGGKIDE